MTKPTDFFESTAPLSSWWKEILSQPGRYTVTFEVPRGEWVLGPWHANREWPNAAGTPDGPCGLCGVDHEAES